MNTRSRSRIFIILEIKGERSKLIPNEYINISKNDESKWDGPQDALIETEKKKTKRSKLIRHKYIDISEKD